jgi:uncharacterized membrane protein
MTGLTVSLVLHVLGVVIWIGGVAMVTTVIIPAARKLKRPEEQIALFTLVEHRFAWLARGAVLIVGLSGVDMVQRLRLWSVLDSLSYWWLCAMVLVWLVFALILFVAEPLLKTRIEKRMLAAPEHSLARFQLVHWILLLLSALAIAGGVAGSHGLSLFG